MQESPEVTARQTIPSERVHVEQQMKKYGKENKLINVVSLCQKKNKKLSINFSDISSLNISKSTANIFAEINSPSVSSLSYRPDDAIDDLSFNFSNFQREDPQADKNAWIQLIYHIVISISIKFMNNQVTLVTNKICPFAERVWITL